MGVNIHETWKEGRSTKVHDPVATVLPEQDRYRPDIQYFPVRYCNSTIFKDFILGPVQYLFGYNKHCSHTTMSRNPLSTGSRVTIIVTIVTEFVNTNKSCPGN